MAVVERDASAGAAAPMRELSANVNTASHISCEKDKSAINMEK
jgi:hypothetical protein